MTNPALMTEHARSPEQEQHYAIRVAFSVASGVRPGDGASPGATALPAIQPDIHEMTDRAGFALDPRAVRRHFDRAARSYDQASLLAREIAHRMDERLDYIKLTPTRWLDVGCGTGADLARLHQRYPDAQGLALDLSLPMLQAKHTRPSLLGRLFPRSQAGPSPLCADASALPLESGCVSLCWSNLMLNWLSDPLPALTEAHRVLEVDGLLMFSTLGPDTLKELRASLPDHGGERVHRFIDMHDLGDALVKAGFADPVMDMEMLTLTYASFDELLADLRLSGCNNAAVGRPRGLSGRRQWEEARASIERYRQDGRIAISFEVVQGHAWKPAPRTTNDGRAVIRFMNRPGDKA